jgi:hypothetical protein
MKAELLDPALPGVELVEQGLADLEEGRTTEHSLLLMTAGPSLRRLGLKIPEPPTERPYNHLLYEKLEERLGKGAYSHYNSLIRRIVSYTHALERRTAGKP